MSVRRPASSSVSSATIPRLFDTHCHIGLIRRERDPVPAGQLPPAAIGPLSTTLIYDARSKATSAFKSNVQRFMIVGIDDVTSHQSAFVTAVVTDCAEEAKRNGTSIGHFWTGYSVGIHPHYAMNYEKQWPMIDKLAREGCTLGLGGAEAGVGAGAPKARGTADSSAPKAVFPVAIGETGLDYFKSHSTPEQQKANLKAHLDLALELDLPLIIHYRDAYDDLFKCFEEWGVKKMKGVLHCFSSGVKDMMKGVELGLKISFCGTLTYPKSNELREAFAACPPHALVFETDAPFLPPQSQRGGINEPGNIAEVALFAAKVRGEDPVALAELAWKNSCELFQIEP